MHTLWWALSFERSFCADRQNSRMHASNLLKAVLKPRSMSAKSSKNSLSLGDHGAKSKRSMSFDSCLPSAASITAKKLLSASSSTAKVTCMCSPTNHPGSFRCRLHRAQSASIVPSSPCNEGCSAESNKEVEHAEDDSILNEVNRTIPGWSRSLSSRPQGRTSRLNQMTLGRETKELDAHQDDTTVSPSEE